MTNQREMILRELVKSQQHMTADELYDRVRKFMPRISLATVYRNLEILSEAGIIGKLEISGRQKRFDYDPCDHDHIYCVSCHRLDNLDLATRPLKDSDLHSVKGYNVTGYRLELVGVCADCRKKEKQEDGKDG